MKKFLTIIFLLFYFQILHAEEFKIEYPDPEIKKIIIEAVTRLDEGVVNEDIVSEFNWDKYYEKYFINTDCEKKTHKGIVIYYYNKPAKNTGVIAIFIELQNQKPIHYAIVTGWSIDQLVNEISLRPYQFNSKCLGD